MKLLLVIFIYLGSTFPGIFFQEEQLRIVQNKPVLAGVAVTFTIVNTGPENPYIAWDFGDGKGLGLYRNRLTATYIYNTPGVYQVFARIQGEDIPLSVVQTVIKSVQSPAPTHSSTIAIDTVNKKVWAVNADNNTVSCIDAVSFKLLREISVGKHPRCVDVDNSGNAWITNQDDATISVVKGTGQIIRTIPMPYASQPFGICIDPQGTYGYVCLQAAGKVVKLNISTQKIIGTVDLGKSPRGIAVSSNGKRVFVTQFISPADHGLVRELNAETMLLSKEFSLAFDQTPDFEDKGRGVPNYISGVTISPDGTEAWVPSKKDNVARGLFRDGKELTFESTVRTIASKINLVTNKENLPSRIDFNDGDMACAVEFSPYGNMAFVAMQGNNKVNIVEIGTNARLGSLDTTGLAPQGLVFNSDGSKLFVHNFMSRTVRVYETTNMILSNSFDPVMLTDIKTVQKENLTPEVLRGKQIFYNAQDPRMTFAGYISCASCHIDGGSDERVWDFTDRGEGLRNTHTLKGRRGTGMGNVHWTGNFDEIQDFENDIRNAFKGSGFMSDSLFHSLKVSLPLGTAKAGLSPDLDALAAYVNSLDKVNPSPYRNADGSFTNSAIEGKIIFSRLGCAGCHAGTDFTDRKKELFHDVGTILPSSGKRINTLLAGFATPTLKGIWESAPYLHDGSAPTLKDVLLTKNKNKKHGDLSALSESEISDLISYLLQIDDSESITPTGLADNTREEGNFNLIPNPSSDKVEISLNTIGFSSGQISIQSSVNQLVYYSEFITDVRSVVFNLKDFPNGMYFVTYISGESQTVKKLVINK